MQGKRMRVATIRQKEDTSMAKSGIEGAVAKPG